MVEEDIELTHKEQDTLERLEDEYRTLIIQERIKKLKDRNAVMKKKLRGKGLFNSLLELIPK